MKLPSLDTEVAINLIVEVCLVINSNAQPFILILSNSSFYFFCLMTFQQISRFDDKSPLWRCGSWRALPLAITRSFLLPCSWYQSIFLLPELTSLSFVIVGCYPFLSTAVGPLILACLEEQ